MVIPPNDLARQGRTRDQTAAFCNFDSRNCVTVNATREGKVGTWGREPRRAIGLPPWVFYWAERLSRMCSLFVLWRDDK